MARVTIPVPEDLVRRVREHPEDFGLPPQASASRIYAYLLEYGAQALLRAREEVEMARAYDEWADDPESRRASEEAARMAFEDGLL